MASSVLTYPTAGVPQYPGSSEAKRGGAYEAARPGGSITGSQQGSQHGSQHGSHHGSQQSLTITFQPTPATHSRASFEALPRKPDDQADQARELVCIYFQSIAILICCNCLLGAISLIFVVLGNADEDNKRFLHKIAKILNLSGLVVGILSITGVIIYFAIRDLATY